MKNKSKNEDRLEIDRVVFVGRTFHEYVEFFNLDIDSLKGKTVLDCPSGPSSFVAEANEIGIKAVGCDPMYDLTLEDLGRICERDIKHVMEELSEKKHLFKWNYYASVEDVKNSRTRSLNMFKKDFISGLYEKRYIKAALPSLPFPDNSFDLVLCAHFLFLYDDRFDYAFHLNSMLELCRVCSKEVRIYPLESMNANLYHDMDRLIFDLGEMGCYPEITKVDFEFLAGSNSMLRIANAKG